MSSVVESKFMRVGMALALAIIQVLPGAICFSISFETDMLAMAYALLGLIVFGIADFFIFLLLDSGVDCKGASKFFKNLLFYILFVGELATALLGFISYVSSGDDLLAELPQNGGLMGLSLHGIMTFSWIIKFFVYFKMADGKLLPQWALPYVSVGSMVLGYLVALALTAIGLTAQFVIQWVPFIVFMAGAILLVVSCFKKGAIFYPRYSSTGGYKPLPSDMVKRMEEREKKKKPQEEDYGDVAHHRDTGTMNKIYDQLGKYCADISGWNYAPSDYFRDSGVNYEVNFTSNSPSDYIGKFYVKVTYRLSDEGKRHYSRAQSVAESYSRNIHERVEMHRQALEKMLRRIVRENHPIFNGTCKIKYGYTSKVSVELKEW